MATGCGAVAAATRRFRGYESRRPRRGYAAATSRGGGDAEIRSRRPSNVAKIFARMFPGTHAWLHARRLDGAATFTYRADAGP